MKTLINIFNIILAEFSSLFIHFIIYYPNSPIGGKIRGKYYRRLFKTKDTPLVSRGARFEHPKSINIGNNFVAGEDVVINAANSHGIFIGNYVAVAHNTFIRSGNHSIDNLDLPISKQGHTCNRIDYKGKKYSIVIEDNVWIGASCTILSGSHIGEGSVLNAGSVISNKIPPNSIVVGNPGRVVLNRKRLKDI